MNSWTRLPCYPRSSFYPVSHGHSTLNRGITKPDFRPCATCWSCSQAPLCLYTQRLVSIQPEGTFGRLCYAFGGDRSQSNYPPATVPMPDNGDRLEPRINQGGISTVAPPRLASQLQSLPPILHRFSPNSMASCSKASRGLFVPLRVTCIFTRPSMFAESLVETVLLSLRHSCGSDLTRQGISLP